VDVRGTGNPRQHRILCPGGRLWTATDNDRMGLRSRRSGVQIPPGAPVAVFRLSFASRPPAGQRVPGADRPAGRLAGSVIHRMNVHAAVTWLVGILLKM